MSKAAVIAKKVAKKWDNFQRRIEAAAALDAHVAICDGCRQPVVALVYPLKDETDESFWFRSRCICGSETGTFYSYPTIALAE